MFALRHTLICLALAFLATSGCLSRADYHPSDDETAIRLVLAAQQAAWNRGDIEGFMDGYAKSDSIRFASGGTVERGWSALLERYHRAYPDQNAMGTLTFDIHDVRVLSPQFAVVFGAYHLQRTNDEPTGLFTLLFEKQEDGWLAVHDHTSAAP